MKRARKALLGGVAEIFVDATGAEVEFTGRSHVTHAWFTIGQKHRFLSVDAANQPNIKNTIHQGSSLSLMGRYATDEDLSEFPEIDKIAVPLLAVEVTAANKLLTLYWAAETRNYDLLRDRGRDLYDLACIARSVHVEQVKNRVPRLAERLGTEGIHKSRITDTRPRRLGSSQAFIPDTDACRAMRQGYKEAQQTIWGKWRPGFEEAAALAASLDPA